MKKNSNCQTKLFWQNLKKRLSKCNISLNRIIEIVILSAITQIVANIMPKSNFGLIFVGFFVAIIVVIANIKSQ